MSRAERAQFLLARERAEQAARERRVKEANERLLASGALPKLVARNAMSQTLQSALFDETGTRMVSWQDKGAPQEEAPAQGKALSTKEARVRSLTDMIRAQVKALSLE